MVHAKLRPGVLQVHFQVTGNRGTAKTNFGIGEFETSPGTRQGNMLGFAGEFVDHGLCLAFQEPGYFHPGSAAIQVGFKMYPQVQGLCPSGTGGCKNREHVAEWLTGATGEYGLERLALRLISTFVDDNLADAIAVLDLPWPFVQRRPV